ncbi:survival protein sure [Lucifera butyrica]|uniref:5'-nucleotidase SurE n=1 Tax=Lucifera butyrica TaxID=1351585 RepID=A0A498R8S1_9FIRM|nr:5'/3'-nucleotidase SurE [Lucifera butyrica]VBB07914.1 survival protein sure [Lucifera butyrica]
MHVLLTNDDGINAQGIQALWKAIAEIATVTVVAPDVERSATSQAITVHHPIRVDRHCIENPAICAWRIGGTPTDCVKIALEALLPAAPDIVVSGINHGPNLGTDVLYSGTVSAAIEAAMHRLPAIAVSLDNGNPFEFETAAQFTRRLLLEMPHHSLPPNTLLNVNIPSLQGDKIQGVAITKLGVRRYENTFERRQDPRGRIYYWMGGQVADEEDDPATDVTAIKNGKISITPIHFDLTNYGIIQEVRNWNLSFN